MKLRVNLKTAAKPTVIRTIRRDGVVKIINFGSRGAFVRIKEGTKTSGEVKELIHAPTDEDLAYIMTLGKSKLVEEYDEVAEKATLQAIEKQTKEIEKAQAEYETKNKELAAAGTKTTTKAAIKNTSTNGPN